MANNMLNKYILLKATSGQRLTKQSDNIQLFRGS